MNKNSQNIINLLKENSPINDKKPLINLLLFLILFVVIIPFFLLKFKYYMFLEGYMPNVDLIANLLSWHGGYGLWNNLYSPISISGFNSQTIINYISLLGVSFIVSIETKKTKSFITGLSLAFIMILIKYHHHKHYSRIISWIMDKIYVFLKKKYFRFSYITSFIVGCILTLGVIITEINILSFLKKPLQKLIKFIINLSK
jgi:hypothetical protein